jgi:tight adherence protein C
VSAAVFLAALAGITAAAGVAELAAAGRERHAAAPRPARHAAAPRAATRVAVPRRGALLGALARLGGTIGVPSAPGDLDQRLAAAGLAGRLSAGEVMAAKTGAGLVALLGALALIGALPGRLGAALVVAAPCAAFLAPDAWLRRRAVRRGTAMGVELADVLDLLQVAIGAGLAPTRALAEVARRRPGPLTAELAATVARIELGVPRSAALGELVARCPLAAIEALVAALERADRHGTPVAPALAALATQARADRARDTRERAARAAPKIQLAVALGVVPGVLLLVAAALVAALT